MPEHEREPGPEAEALSDPKLETAVFGREIEQFIENDRIGQWLVERARLALAEVQQQLLTVDPEDPKAIRALQNRAAVAEMVRGWLADAIREGRQAEILLQQERENE